MDTTSSIDDRQALVVPYIRNFLSITEMFLMSRTILSRQVIFFTSKQVFQNKCTGDHGLSAHYLIGASRIHVISLDQNTMTEIGEICLT